MYLVYLCPTEDSRPHSIRTHRLYAASLLIPVEDSWFLTETSYYLID